MIENFNKEVADKAAEALGWRLDKDGFLIHPLGDEEEAQRIWNEAYKRKEINRA